MVSKVRVKVTQEMINTGVQSNSSMCPVALAASSALGKYVSWGLRTGTALSSSISNNKLVLLSGSDAVEDFVRAFDSGKEVKPFEFDMEVSE